MCRSKRFGTRWVSVILFMQLWQPVRAQWSTVFDYQGGPSTTIQGVEQSDGAFITLTLSGLYNDRYTRYAGLVALSSEGVITEQLNVEGPNGLPGVFGLHVSPITGEFMLPGVLRDTLAFQGQNSSALGIWIASGDLSLLEFHGTNIGARNHFGGSSAIDAEGSCSVAAVAYEYFEDGYQAVVGAKWGASGLLQGSDTIVQYLGYGSAHDLCALPNGRMALLAYHNTNSSPGQGSVGLFKLDNELEVLEVHPLYLVDPEQAFSLNAPFDNLDVMPLSSGNFIVGGTHSPFLDGQWRSVLQLTDPFAEPLAQHVFTSPYPVDFAAQPNCLDMGTSGNFLFCHTENTQSLYEIESGFGTPSRVHLWRMDTALQVVGDFLFDGSMDDRYYHATGVVNSMDGGAFVYGLCYDLNATIRRRKAWVAKIGADQFTGIQEQPHTPLTLYPNPGKDGFMLSTERVVDRAVVTICNAQGIVVQEQPLSRLNTQIQTNTLASGLYIVRLGRPDGTLVGSARWVKE